MNDVGLPPEWASWTIEQKDSFMDELRYNWRNWARPNQLPPPDDWDIWLLLAGRGFGKALALDTPIPTPTGWSTMGDLVPGDQIFDETGAPCRVTFVAEVQHERICYEVRFDDESVIVADAEHRWLTWDKAARKAHGRSKNPTVHPAIRTTAEIAASVRIGHEVNHSVPVTGPLALPDADLPVHPYTLGAWLGDGSSAEGAITIGDEDATEMLEMLASFGTAVTGTARRREGSSCATYPIGGLPGVRSPETGRMVPNDGLYSRLRSLGVVKNKHIPSIYLRGSERQRRDLLAGLIDTDGTNSNGHVEFCSTNRALADGVFELAVSLGYKPAVYNGRATLDGRDCGPKYRVCWTVRDSLFGLRRKDAKTPSGKAQAGRTKHRYIVDVVPVESVPVRCIQVDSPSHLFLAGAAMIPTHNTRTGAEYVKERMRQEPGIRVGIIGQTIGAARDICVEGESGLLAVINPKHVQKYNRSLGQLRLKNGSSAYTFSGGDPEKLRGFQSHYLWLDELCAFNDAQTTYDMGLMGMRLGRNPRMIVTTTPKPTPLIVELVNRSRAEPDRVRITTGSTFDNAANLAESTLNSLRARYEGTTIGRQELYAELILEEPGALWKRSLIDKNRVPSGEVRIEDMSEIVIGVDPNMSQSTERTTECGIIVAGRGRDGHGYLLHDGSMLRPSPDAWAAKVVSLYHEYQANQVVAEVNQGYDLVVHTIHTVDSKVPVKKVYSVRGKSLRAEPIAALSEQGRIHHLGSDWPELEDQMVQWVPGSQSPDRLDAYVHAFTKLMLGGGLAEFFTPSDLPRLPGFVR